MNARTTLETLGRLAARLASGETTSRALTERCLAAVFDPDGEGSRVFPHGVADDALAQAERQDALRRAGHAPSPYAGAPISVKDNMDVAGEITRAGARLLDDDPPAKTDAPIVARLRGAGFVVMGRTAMTEFAFSGLGFNPHYGTPANPFTGARARIRGAPRPARPYRWRPAWWWRRSAPTPVAPAASRPPFAAWSVGSRVRAASRWRASSLCRRRSTPWARSG